MLTDPAIKNVAAQAKPNRLANEHGLYLLLNPNSSRW
jgi:hypothetical protein